MSDEPRVLVVDDDETFRKTICRELGHMGFHVSDAPNGQVAIDATKSDPPDVILLDIRMPGMDGIQALDVLRSEAEQVQVVMLTGQGVTALANLRSSWLPPAAAVLAAVLAGWSFSSSAGSPGWPWRVRLSRRR